MLPGYLQQVRTILFGVEPDGLFANYRVRQLLSVLESTDLRGFLFFFDNRITYELNRDTVPGSVFTPSIAGDTYAFNLLGTPAAPDTLGISHYRFDAKVAGSNLLLERQGKYPASFTEQLAITDGSSQGVLLEPTGYSLVYVVPGPAQPPQPSPEVTVDIYLRPRKSVEQLTQELRQLPADVFPKLFGSATYEPYVTFKNCWYNSPELHYQLAGLLLAYVHRVTELQLNAAAN
jgi:hypothetical protein